MVAEPLEPRQLFAAGALDASFGGDGKVVTSGQPDGAVGQVYYGYRTGGATGTVVQPDGKLLMVDGSAFSDEGYTVYSTFVVRLNADGTRDTSFGDGGFAGVGGGESYVDTPDLALDGSGRIYAVSNSDFDSTVIVRLRADGQPDTTFNGSGYMSLDFAMDAVSGVAVQSDGKAVVTGRRDDPSGDSVIVVARLNANGLVDTSFGGGDGFATKDFGYDWQTGADVAVRTDGRLAIACNVAPSPGFGSADRMGLWIVDAAGNSIKSATVDVPGGGERAAGVVLGSGNVAYVFGHHSASGGSRVAIAKFDAAGNLATAFGGGDGIATSAFTVAGYLQTKSVAVAADGKLLLTSEDSTAKRVHVARLTTGGSPDTSFDGDGLRTLDFGSQYARANAVARLADGDVLVTGGRTTPNGEESGILLYRLNGNGSPDTAFTPNGTMFVDFDAANAAADVAVMSDGRIVSAGYQLADNGQGNILVTRHLANGNVDYDFDEPENYWDWLGHNDGRVLIDLGGDDRATAVDLMPDGRVVVAGYTTLSGGKARFFVIRLLANGQLDPAFGGGIRRFDFGSTFNARAWDVKVQADGKVVVAGGAGNASSATAGDFAVARLNANGTLDTSFSGDGKQRVNFGSNLSTVARGLKVLSNGRIVLAGWAGGNAAVARLLANGNPDNAFSGDGKLTTDWGTSTDQYYGVDVDAAGKVIVGGSAGSNMVAARYTASGVLDTTFDGDGKRTGPTGRAHAVLVQSSGRVILAGANSTTTSSAFRLVRFTASGAYDTLFSGDGQVDATFGGKSPRAANGLAFAPGDKIVAVGFTTGSDGDQDFALARYSFV